MSAGPIYFNTLCRIMYCMSYPISELLLHERHDDGQNNADVPRLVDQVDAFEPGWKRFLWGRVCCERMGYVTSHVHACVCVLVCVCRCVNYM